MRLSPIEKPRGAMLRLAYRVSKRRLGKVITPLKVVYARVPRSLKLGYAVNKFMERGLSLDPGLRLLLQTQVAQLNGCGFCVDIARAHADEAALDMDKLGALADYRNDARFSARERAALAYVEEATREKRVSDETFAELQRHFSEKHIVEITLINAVEHFYNMVNLPLKIESDGLCAVPGSQPFDAGRQRTATG